MFGLQSRVVVVARPEYSGRSHNMSMRMIRGDDDWENIVPHLYTFARNDNEKLIKYPREILGAIDTGKVSYTSFVLSGFRILQDSYHLNHRADITFHVINRHVHLISEWKSGSSFASSRIVLITPGRVQGVYSVNLSIAAALA